MLVVIAVIGVIAAIAVPTIGNITSSAKKSTDKRNGQNLASVYSAAIAAGTSSFAAPADAAAGFTAAEKTAIATSLAAGVTGSVETGFDTTIFKVPAISNISDVLTNHIDEDFSYKP